MYICVDVSFSFFFCFFCINHLISFVRSFACSATIFYRLYRESIIVCINIIPLSTEERKRPGYVGVEASRSCLRARLVRPCCMKYTTIPPDRSIILERTGVSSLLSLSLSLSFTHSYFSSSLSLCIIMFFLFFYLKFHYSRTAPSWTFMHLLQCLLDTSSIANKYHFLWLLI